MQLHATVVPVPSIRNLDALTYRVPEALVGRRLVGARVLVPLGRRCVTGIVTATGIDPPRDLACKELIDAIDEEALFTDELLELSLWMATYYGVPLAEVLALAVPRGLTASSKRLVTIQPEAESRGPLEAAIIGALVAEGGTCDTGRLRRLLGGRSFHAALTRLASRGAITFEDSTAEPEVRARTQRYLELAETPDGEEFSRTFGRAYKQRQMFEHLLGCPGRRISIAELAKLFPSPHSQITALEKLGLVRKVDLEVYRGVCVDAEADISPPLTGAQKLAGQVILGALGTFGVSLLKGVTSSGKTEVYLQAVRVVLERGGSALVLVPEISLTHQTVARLVARFGPTVAVLHSELSAGERWDEWRRIRHGDARIAVGARSAVFAPLDRLGIIIVDEEHDGAYKQEDGVRYHARDVAIMRAQKVGCPVVLGSATPSIESWNHTTTGRYRCLELPDRVTASPLPKVEVVDLRGRDIYATGGLSERLRELVCRTHAEHGQSLLFLNRRGYAASVQCYECGEIETCDDCSVGMTFHRNDCRIRCHHCDRERALPQRCTGCSKDALVTQGLGTQRLEDTLTELLPDARVERLDRDSTRKKNRARDVLADWRAGLVDVLIGTQMVAKGHDAAGVTLVGVIHADLGLGVPDFRSAERTFQILTQVAGRAGRGERAGRVVLQTYRPDHFAIAAAVRHDYEAFAREELNARSELGYPPFSRLALVRIEGRSRTDVEGLAQAIGRSLRALAKQTPSLVVRGPAPSPIERIKSRFRYQIQLRASESKLVRHAALEANAAFRDRAHGLKLRLLVDIDPVDML